MLAQFAALGAVALAALDFAGQLFVASCKNPARRMARAAEAVADTFDPWTVLGISTDASSNEARKAYRKLVAKYHPDVDPSAEAELKFNQIVRAHAVVTGEDRELPTTTLLKNAVQNFHNDIEFKRQQIEKLKRQAAEEEANMLKMADQLKEAEAKREKETQELGAFGGAALGLVAGGPVGLVVGGLVGLAVKDREDAAGQVVRGVGSVARSVVQAVSKASNSAK